MTTVARVIGRRLHEAGVRYVMGHPGGEVVDLIDGFREEGLEFVLTRHETAAAFMADAIGASTGIPGVCLGTLGPGATNLVTGVAQAYLDRSPVIALSGQLPADRYELATHQRLDLGALFAPITKWHARVTAANADDMIARSLRVSVRPRPGPVFLEIPSDVPLQEARQRPADMPAVARAAGFSAGAGQAAARLLAESRRPLILAGLDANDGPTAEVLRRFAEEWTIPVMVGPKAKGAFPEDHPLFLGTIEMFGTSELYRMIDESDLVLMVGFEPVELDRDWAATATIVNLGPLPNDDLYYRAAAELVGPTREALEALRAAAGAPRAKRELAAIRTLRTSFVERIHPKVAGMSSQQVLAELRRVLPKNALVTCDVGYNKAITGQCWPAYEPKTFFMSNGLSTMGYGLPAALGLQLVHPDRVVACVLGDGGFGMLLGEVETAVRRELPVLAVVLVDAALSQIKLGQERKRIPATGTTIGAVDYLALAKAFGAEGFVARTPGECAEAFRSALATRRPAIVAAYIDPACYRI